jgi:hypothetical protein
MPAVNPWFRMYAEFAHDPKIQMMNETMQRRYVMLMCMRCSNTLVTLQVTEIAFHLRISEQELTDTKALFIAKGFIDDEWNLLNWDKRQFISDTSRVRVAKHRALQKEKQPKTSNEDVTLLKRGSNALDTDTDTDTDTEKKTIPPGFARFWSVWPKSDRKGAKGKCLEVWVKAKAEPHAERICAHVDRLKASKGWTKDGGEFIPAPLAYLNQRKWEGVDDAPSSGWWMSAGFSDQFEAENAGCRSSNAAQFREGKRIPEAA